MGAVATGGVVVLNRDLVRALAIPDHLIETVAAREMQELALRGTRVSRRSSTARCP
jgi:predicted phosphoribosyltransferase